MRPIAKDSYIAIFKSLYYKVTDYSPIIFGHIGTVTVKKTRNFYVDIVPFEFSRELAEQLDAKFYPVQKGGHFLDRDGFTSFDLVYEVTIEMIK